MPKITKAEKSEKIKDPKKVEAGKRLAAISRKVRERTIVDVNAVSAETEDCSTSINYKYIVGGVGVVAAVGSLYFLCERSEVRYRREVSAVSMSTANEVKPEKMCRQVQQVRVCCEA